MSPSVSGRRDVVPRREKVRRKGVSPSISGRSRGRVCPPRGVDGRDRVPRSEKLRRKGVFPSTSGVFPLTQRKERRSVRRKRGEGGKYWMM